MTTIHAPSEALTEVSNQETPLVISETPTPQPIAEKLPVPVILGRADREQMHNMHAMTQEFEPLPPLAEAQPVLPQRRALHLGRLGLRNKKDMPQPHETNQQETNQLGSQVAQTPPRYARAMALMAELGSQAQQPIPVVDPAARATPVIGYRAHGLEPISADELAPRRDHANRPPAPAEVPAWAKYGNSERQQYPIVQDRNQ